MALIQNNVYKKNIYNSNQYQGIVKLKQIKLCAHDLDFQMRRQSLSRKQTTKQIPDLYRAMINLY